MDIHTTKKLNNGVEIPYLGLGVFRCKDGDETINAVRWAIEAGYRHIDTAAAYGNEKSVGQGIHDSGINRKELFVTTKLLKEDMVTGTQIKGLENSLKLLQLDYVDLYLIHWPVPGKTWESWKRLLPPNPSPARSRKYCSVWWPACSSVLASCPGSIQRRLPFASYFATTSFLRLFSSSTL